jgi:tRNA-dihydrouridine synthase 1
MLENEVDAIDLNFGCPQGIARRGHYGSFLLHEPDLIIRIIETMSQGLKVPLFCKMRVLKNEEQTIDLCKRMEKAGCKLLTVHGRTREQNKELVGLCDWSFIRKVKETVTIPVIANGGIYNYADVEDCLEVTGADGVMSA